MTVLPGYAVPVEVVAKPTKNGILLLDFRSGECFHLDPIGARAWLLADEGCQSLTQISKVIATEYKVSVSQVERDLAHLFKALVASQLMVLCT